MIEIIPVFFILLHTILFICAPGTPCFGHLCVMRRKKVAYFMKKVGKLFCQFAELSYLCTRFRKNFPVACLKEAIFDILQTATRQRLPVPVPPGNSGDCSSKKIRRFIYKRIQWIPIERICPGQNTDNFFQVSVTPHLIILYI